MCGAGLGLVFLKSKKKQQNADEATTISLVFVFLFFLIISCILELNESVASCHSDLYKKKRNVYTIYGVYHLCVCSFPWLGYGSNRCMYCIVLYGDIL